MSSAADIARRGSDTAERVRSTLTRRRRAEARFRLYGLLSITVGLTFLVILFASILVNGYSVFRATYIGLDVDFDPTVLGVENGEGSGGNSSLAGADFGAVIRSSLAKVFPDVRERPQKKALMGMISSEGPDELRALLLRTPDLLGSTTKVWLLADDDTDSLAKGQFESTASQESPIVAAQLGWIKQLRSEGRLEFRFNRLFFSRGDSREPEMAGIWGAVVGSAYTLLVTICLALPIGVAAAIYLEEFAPRNKWTDLIEVNINNLAAVPSVVFGLLGLAVFINFFGMPRSSPLVGGVVLTLMTLPVIIIAGRSALKSVPPSVREAALGIGASSMQTVFHHVLPLAIPGMLTGAIIGLARALGESAPLLMIGMVAFIVDIPQKITQPATVLPVQIYLWADSPERAFVAKTSAAIIVLLTFLILMNGLAVYLRRRYEKRW